MTLLSIIIPHYNSTETLLKLLRSIPNNREIQTLVVDDHSNDQEKKKLKGIKSSVTSENVHFFENDPNKKGAGSSRNVGLAKAVGEWVIFADSDDFFVDGFYEILEQYFNTDYDTVFFKPTSVELDTGNPSNRHIRYEEIINDYVNDKSRRSELQLRYKFFVPWSKLIRRKIIIENNILFENVVASNDVMFSTKIGYFTKDISVSEDIIYCATKSKGSLTSSVNNSAFDARLEVFIRYYRFLQKHLGEDDFNALDLSGQGYIYKSRNYGVKKMYSVFRTLRSNKVKIISSKMLNPIWFLKRFAIVSSRSKKAKRFRENS